MKKAVLSVLLAFVASVSFGVPAIAFEKCPVDGAETEKSGSYVVAVEAAVRNAPSCDRAAQTLERCQLGSTADNQLSGEVMSKCEADFMDKIDAANKDGLQKGAGPLHQDSGEKRRDDVSILCGRLSGRRLAGFCAQIFSTAVTETSHAPSSHGIVDIAIYWRRRGPHEANTLPRVSLSFSSNGKSLFHAVAP